MSKLFTIHSVESYIASTLSHAARIGDENHTTAAHETSWILAEVRHYCASVAALDADGQRIAGERLLEALSTRYVAPQPKQPT